MSFEPGEVMCENCGEIESNHCADCGSCRNEAPQECCMAGWSEEAKTHERKVWAKRYALRSKS